MAYKSIVCGVTGSESSRKSGLASGPISQRKSGRPDLCLCGGCQIPERLNYSDHFGFRGKDPGDLGGHILERAEESAAAQGVTPRKVIRSGAVLEVLKQVIQEEKADLLMLGHEDRSFFEKILFGGEVEDHVQELIKQTGVSVQVVK